MTYDTLSLVVDMKGYPVGFITIKIDWLTDVAGVAHLMYF
jgi:hypothetical protein